VSVGPVDGLPLAARREPDQADPVGDLPGGGPLLLRGVLWPVPGRHPL